MKRFFSGVFLSVATMFLLSGTALAHVSVKPAEVQTGSFQTFTVSVPNERDAAVSGLVLQIPTGLSSVTPTEKPGWTVTIQKTSEGDTATVTGLTWTGGNIDAGFRDDFTFSAQAPASPGQLQWKAVQTYADGVVVQWTLDPSVGEAGETETSGPFSVTQVVSETAETTAANTAADSAENAKSTATWALYIAIAGVIVALVAVYLAVKN